MSSMNTSTHDLGRFVAAQDPVYDTVRGELRSGCKTSHWMWFVFPQLKQLGRSSIAKHFGIADAEEAAAYFSHPVLGPRLEECAELVLAVKGKTANDIFGSPDDIKLRSCMTLFDTVVRDEEVFARVLDRFFNGERDPETLRLLRP